MKLLFSKKLLKNKKIYGEANGQHKVTVHEVREIREMYENRNYTQRGLGRLFGIGKTTVWSIVNYKTWK